MRDATSTGHGGVVRCAARQGRAVHEASGCVAATACMVAAGSLSLRCLLCQRALARPPGAPIAAADLDRVRKAFFASRPIALPHCIVRHAPRPLRAVTVGASPRHRARAPPRRGAGSRAAIPGSAAADPGIAGRCLTGQQGSERPPGEERRGTAGP
eukprot:scaffold1127_cov361-Prasinococcus_capsulatus_cf.AAC.1